MNGRNAIFVVVDGLRASAAGAYGNAWHPTPALDRLASQSQVVEWMWSAQPNEELAVFCPRDAVPKGNLPRGNLTQHEVAKADVAKGEQSGSLGQICCVTDDAAWAQRWTSRPHIDCALIEDALTDQRAILAREAATHHVAPQGLDDPTLESTCLEQLFCHAAEALPAWGETCRQNVRDGHLLWIRSRGMHGPWDAPLAYRAALCDAEDPPPPAWVEPPDALATSDPEELFAYRVAYAAQVTLFDQCLGAFLTAVDEFPWAQRPLVVLVGRRGFALGEHGRVGRHVADLYGEWLHIPCFIRLPGAAPGRLRGLAQYHDLNALLTSWLGNATLEGDVLSTTSNLEEILELGRPYLRAANGTGQRALRTVHWSLVIQGTEWRRLFVKPDDRWEVNEVADLCPEAVAALLAMEGEASSTPAASRSG